MQIQNEAKTAILPQNGNPVTIKEGGTYSATITEKLPNNEAIVQIKGQDMHVKFEGSMPDAGKITLQMVNGKQDIPVVKAVALPTAPISNTGSGQPLPENVRQAVQVLHQYHIPISRETLNNIRSYIEKGPGTSEQRLETIINMAKKQLDFTPNQIKAVHEALHGRSLGSVLNELVQESNPDFKIQNPSINRSEANREIQQTVLNQTSNVVQDTMREALKQLKTSASLSTVLQFIKGKQELPITLNHAVERALQLQASGRELDAKQEIISALTKLLTSEKPIQVTSTDILSQGTDIQSEIQEALKQVKTAPNLLKVLQFIKENTLLQNLPEIQKNNLQQSVEKAELLQAGGRALAARHEIAMGLTNLVEAETLTQPEQEADAAYRISNDILASIPVQSRDLIVTTITKKLSQAALDFKAVKRDILNTLRTTELLLKQAPLQARQLLEAVIKQLDNAILKSDFMLFTDMGTEKKLMQASSQLHEARKLLGKGDFIKANEIVNQVKNTVDKLIFQPSDQRVKHFVSKELLNLEQFPVEKEIVRSFNEPYQTLRQEPSARNAFEYIRRLGLTYDSDIAHRLVSGDGSRTDADASLKNSLLKLIQAEGNNAASQKAEQALNNLTGQQLMSKTDSSGLQTMLFTLPIILRDQLEDVKVFLKSNQSKQKIDWENCSLYFLLETKRMGDVGILLTSVDKTLSVTIKNDRLGFQNKMEPLVKTAKGRLEEIGYKIGAIQFSRLTSIEKTEEPKEQNNPPRFTERGYDFSV
ncbi:hypothetical protein [Lederbergia panacisoli]|uniref:hypothetical protein n=1 Tax=Lederbergia panacisoli TaxID=1255251 RepID=UPI00214B4293|nr:hypothetical protein [Lederbergia panacisoli]MCR2822353.1 hypothetical protein [Lederbergia panacisoli]